MQNWTKSNTDYFLIDVLLFEQFSNLCLANTFEPLRAANTIAGRTLYQWNFVSLKGGQVTSSSGLPVSTGKLNDRNRHADFLFSMPSYGYRELSTGTVLTALRQASLTSKNIVGLDTGAWLFAAAGLLDGKKATIHSAVLEDFSERFLSVDVQAERFVIDGTCYTCGGAMAAFDLALYLIGEHHGMAMKLDVEQFLLYRGNSPDPVKRQKGTGHWLVRRALQLMDQNIETPLTIDQIASRLGFSNKELQRKFLRHLGATPSRVYRHKKLSHAKMLLLSTDLTVTEIAGRCGYESASAMTRAFKTAFEITPLQLRAGSS